MSVDSFGYLIEKSTRLGTIYFWRTSVNCPPCFARPLCRRSPKGFGQHYRKLGQSRRLVGRPGPGKW